MCSSRVAHRRAVGSVLCALLAVLVLPGVGWAKPWAAYAPGPLASDAAYRKLSGRPAWYRDKEDAAWVEIQWSWREEREQEAAGPGWLHEEFDSDERFAALVALNPRKLHKADRKWLEQEARRRWQLEVLDPHRRGNYTDPVTMTIAVASVIYLIWALRRLSQTGW